MPEPKKRKRTSTPTPPAPEVALVEQAEVPVEPWWEAPANEQGPVESQEPVDSSEVGPTSAPEPAVEICHEMSLEGLLRDNGFMEQMVHAMTQSTVMDSLVEDFADSLKDALGNNPEFRRRLVKAAVSDETFRRRVVCTIARITG